jgi:hypothetical protein
VTAIFPASESLATGAPVHACAGPASERSSKASGYAASIGQGWGHGTSLTWSVSRYPGSLAAEAVDGAFESALREWARHAGIQFTRTGQLRARRNLEFVFGSGDHGDSYPFPGDRTMLAHAFYPAGVNPEPIAGDIHFNADEPWSEGGDRDLYSAALHEIGHSLGLTHSGTPGAVMYPYYRQLTSLNEEDVRELQALYGPPSDARLSIEVSGPQSTPGVSVILSGTVSGGSGDVSVAWSANGASGSAPGGRNWTATSVPVVGGSNEIRISAIDSAGNEAVRIHRLTQSDAPVVSVPSPAPPVSVPAVPAASGDRVPPVLTIASPAGTIYQTAGAKLRISGTARDNSAVTEVTWECGGSGGTAQGTTAWSAEVPLYIGDNSIVVRARDASGNSAWRSILVIRR